MKPKHYTECDITPGTKCFECPYPDCVNDRTMTRDEQRMYDCAELRYTGRGRRKKS